MPQTPRTLTTNSQAGLRSRPIPFAALLAQLILTLTLLASPVLALASDPLRYQTGIRNSPSRGLGKKQISAVLKTLREKTGLLELDFDSDGFLQLGDVTRFIGGSRTARELLAAAVEGDNVFDLEVHQGSRIVAFARLASPISFQSLKTRSQIEVLPVEIDFTDFSRLRGDRQVVSAFDLGMVLLHEFAHGVLGLHDVADEADGLGACETHINQIRRELNLPERQHYFAHVAERQSSVSGAIRPHAELVFTRAATPPGQERRGKRELFILSWEAELVGELRNDSFPTKGRAGTVAMQ